MLYDPIRTAIGWIMNAYVCQQNMGDTVNLGTSETPLRDMQSFARPFALVDRLFYVVPKISIQEKKIQL